MNTNDLPPAAKLAALIEAGRAANPDLKHGRLNLLNVEQDSACALGFAALALGVTREDLVHRQITRGYAALNKAFPFTLVDRVWRVNDRQKASLDEIIASLREGELAKVAA